MALDENARPRLQPFVRLQFDAQRESWVLQAPERVLLLDESGKTILERCDGQATLAEIVASLAAEYDAPRAVIAEDVMAVLGLLAERDLLLLDAEPRT